MDDEQIKPSDTTENNQFIVVDSLNLMGAGPLSKAVFDQVQKRYKKGIVDVVSLESQQQQAENGVVVYSALAKANAHLGKNNNLLIFAARAKEVDPLQLAAAITTIDTLKDQAKDPIVYIEEKHPDEETPYAKELVNYVNNQGLDVVNNTEQLYALLDQKVS